MGEPSLWNMRSTILTVPSHSSFNPSWESRPSGTEGVDQNRVERGFVSTPHGRAVPLELVKCQIPYLGGNIMFQPLMGEPSLWNLVILQQLGRK